MKLFNHFGTWFKSIKLKGNTRNNTEEEKNETIVALMHAYCNKSLRYPLEKLYMEQLYIPIFSLGTLETYEY